MMWVIAQAFKSFNLGKTGKSQTNVTYPRMSTVELRWKSWWSSMALSAGSWETCSSWHYNCWASWRCRVRICLWPQRMCPNHVYVLYRLDRIKSFLFLPCLLFHHLWWHWSYMRLAREDRGAPGSSHLVGIWFDEWGFLLVKQRGKQSPFDNETW